MEDVSDAFTILTTKGLLATKVIRAIRGGSLKIEDYANAAWFSFTEVPVTSFDEMAALLQELQKRPHAFVVRGKPADGIDLDNAPRRLRPRGNEPATLIPHPRRWLALDLDSVPCPAGIDPIFEPDAVVECVIELLSEEFRGASVFWAFTSGHGIKPGIRIRLFYWLDRALSDAEIKTWLAIPIAEKLIDAALYSPAQPTYTAAPIFVGMVDPVPYRSGIWRGYDNTVVVPPVTIEKPQNSVISAAGAQLGNALGYAAYRAQIGDGLSSFYAPLKGAIGAFIHEAGINADTAWLRADLEQAIRKAPRDPALHDDAYVEHRVTDLDSWIAWTLEREKEKPRPATEYCEPAYPKPLGSVEEARETLTKAMRRFSLAALSWTTAIATADRGVLSLWFNSDGMLDLNPRPHEIPPPVHAVNVDLGLGKSTKYREIVIPPALEGRLSPVIAVERHRLGDEYKAELEAAGISSAVYRSRDAADPDNPGKEMCLDLERAKTIEDALGDVSTCACQSKDKECEFFQVCGYQKLRQQNPDAWEVPHHSLFYKRPAFIKCDILGIDESFHNASLRGIDDPYELDVGVLHEVRDVPKGDRATADLHAISRSVTAALEAHPDGRVTRAALIKAGLTAADVGLAYRLEWSRKIEPDVYPSMPEKQYQEECGKVAANNKLVARLGRLWDLLKKTLEAPDERSAWLTLRREPDRDGVPRIIVAMAWREDIHESWRVPTMVMDATMPVEIVRQFYPDMEEPTNASAAMPHTYVRQIIDRTFSAAMLIPTAKANEKTNKTRRNNVEKVRRRVEVAAASVWPKEALVVCQEGLEKELEKGGTLPANLAVRHYNDIRGENGYQDVALVIVIGRTEPSARTVEARARALFGRDVAEVIADEKGVRYPRVVRGIRLRDGTGRKVEGNQHPDSRAETVRWQICEAGLIQAIARGRGVLRTAQNPLRIEIWTSIVLPIEVDEVTTWEASEPGLAEVMRARGAVPLSYRDMAAAYPDLFVNSKAAENALRAERNPPNSPIEKYLIGVLGGFLSIPYRRTGFRGPAARLLYDPRRVEPEAWLHERIGEVTILDEPVPVTDELLNEPSKAEQPAVDEAIAATDIVADADPVAIEPPAVAARRCDWFVNTSVVPFRKCGELIHDGRNLCPVHRTQHAATLLGPPDDEWLPPTEVAVVASSGPPWRQVLDAAAHGPQNNPGGRVIALGQVSEDESAVAVSLTPPPALPRWLMAG